MVKCRRCGKSMSPSRIRLVDVPLLLLLLRPYRCVGCKARVRRLRLPFFRRLPLPQWLRPCLCERWEQRSAPLRWFDLPFALLLHRPFRCDHCLHRFYRFFWY